MLIIPAYHALFFLAILVVCAVTKKWKLLWPLLVFAAASLAYLEYFGAFNIFIPLFEHNPFDHSFFLSARIWRFVRDLTGFILLAVRHASIWLTVYYVGRYFKQKNQLEESTYEHSDSE